jgi:aminopeptidase N
MKRIFIFLLLYAVNCSISFSDNNSAYSVSCVFQDNFSRPYLTEGAPKHAFDVLKYTFNLDLRNCFFPPFPKTFKAWVQVDFRVDTALNSIQLNADNTSLAIDSVRLSGISFTHSGNILSIALNRMYLPGETASVKIFYRHKDVFDGAFFSVTGCVSTATQMERSRMWFPCWDSPSDKALTELTAKVPLSVKFGSNGSLMDSVITGDTIYYHWKSRDPMATYLMFIAGKHNINLDIKYYHKPSNPLDSIPMRFYWGYGENYDSIMFWQSKLTELTNFYSEKTCEYPFEKIGFYSVGHNNVYAMEDQTLIDVGNGNWTEYIITHEYIHQWFGDLITCGTWGDVWLNEGFGTFFECLWLEHAHGYSSYMNQLKFYAGIYFQYGNTSPIYGSNINVNDLVYDKAAGVLHMLRYVTGDSLFFSIMRAYTADTTLRFKNAVTADFNAKVNQVSGENYDWFFNQWIYAGGHPKYNVTWDTNQQDTLWKLNVLIKQTQTQQFFKMPVQIKVYFSSSDTLTEKVNNDVNNQSFSFSYNRKPIAIKFDPYENILIKQVSTAIGITNISSEVPLKYNLYNNYPNPFNPVTNIKFDIAKKSNVSLIIFDIQGREVEKLVNNEMMPGSYIVDWNAQSYASGIYFYRIITGDFTECKKMILVK